MTKRLYILGAGGHGKVVVDAALKMNQWEAIYFLDDQLKGESILGIKVIDVIDNVSEYKADKAEFVVAIGNNEVREKIQRNLQSQNCKLATIIHPFTSIGSNVSIGEGTVIFAGAVVNPSVNIGEGCILNTSCSVDHDSVIKEFVHLSPGVNIAGTVRIEGKCWLGISATVINDITIPKATIVGAGSIVIKDITKSGIYVGNPIRRIK